MTPLGVYKSTHSYMCLSWGHWPQSAWVREPSIEHTFTLPSLISEETSYPIVKLIVHTLTLIGICQKMSNNPGEKFCLRWNEFEKNISTSFRDLRLDKDFFNVTLACENNQIQAHKVILSACSPFFRSVLKQNPHQHPLLYLKGVRYEDITSVLSFMYHGEVNISQDELNSFLEVAEDLKVKGLTQNNLNEEKSEFKPPAERNLLNHSPVSPK